MIETITLEQLTERTVSIHRQRYIEQDGQRYAAGLPHRRAYANSTHGQALLAQDIGSPYIDAIMAVWGTEPTVIETEGEENHV